MFISYYILEAKFVLHIPTHTSLCDPIIPVQYKRLNLEYSHLKLMNRWTFSRSSYTRVDQYICLKPLGLI